MQTMNNWRFLAWPLYAQKITQQLNLQFLAKKTLLEMMIQQPNWMEMVLDGEKNQRCSTGEVRLQYNCILLWFLFYESKIDQN